jgi:leucyl-tRNA synthetase
LEANPTKEAKLTHSGFLNGMVMRDAIDVVITKLEQMGIGKRKINYKMRDAGFSRQRYWGEPFPIVWKDGVAIPLDEKELPLELPHVDKYGPGPEGEGPLANLSNWMNTADGKRETSTMPGYAGSSWYFLRYMDPHNNSAFCDRKVSDYWGQVDLYIGGTEHAVGHLLYSRMWTKVLFDLGYIGHEEPYKKLVNQGMITGKSYFFMRDTGTKDKIVSYRKQNDSATFERFKYGHNYVDANGKLTKQHLKKYLSDYKYSEEAFDIVWEKEGDDEVIYVKEESEKMSKSKYNVDNPDEIVDKYGADTFRMYEMFLGPVEASKPWDTKGIEGVHRFLKKLWRLFYDELKGRVWNYDKASAEELKILHRAIKKIEDDTERFSFNTAVSSFMICINELADLKCHKKEILEPVLVLLAPYAPHIAEELWHLIGNSGSISDASYPVFDATHVIESSKEYPISINGKVRTNINIALDAAQPEVEQIVLGNTTVQKWLEGKTPKKIIYVKNKMVNVVV